MSEQIVKKISSILRKHNYDSLLFSEYVSKRNKFCCDLIVKKENRTYVIKVFSNIDNLDMSVINDIKVLMALLKAHPILIGLKNRYNELEDNTVYVREDLPFITLNTIETIIKNNVYPEVLAKRGGGVVFLDGNLMKQLREDKTITRKELSEKMGVTKRTICAYENESMRPSQHIALKLFDILKDPSLFRKINVLEWSIKFSIDKNVLMPDRDLNLVEARLNDLVKDIGISSYWYKKGHIPFKLTLFSSPENIEGEKQIYPIFTNISENKSDINELNLKCLLLFMDLFQKKGLFIVNDDYKIPDSLIKKNFPIIKIKSLEKIDNEEEFIEFIQEPRS